MNHPTRRRDFLRDLGLSTASLPFLLNLPSLGFANQTKRKQRLVIMFTPNGVVPDQFWPAQTGDKFQLPEIVKPLEPYKDKLLFLKGVCDKIKGEGDSHMRGIGCLLTGVKLLPGNIVGGNPRTSAGWSSGHSIDQEISRFLHQDPATRTRFGTLEFGALVPDRADTWTRMVYAGGNRPIAPIDDPYRMFDKMYGKLKDQEALQSILDDLSDDLKKVRDQVSSDDRHLLDRQATLVREMEKQLTADKKTQEQEKADHPVPELPTGVHENNDNLPKISRMQIDLMINGFLADFNRVATMQYTNSVGQAHMKWLGVQERHHSLSHKPDKDKKSQNDLVKINRWFCGELAYLVKKLSETPEPGTNQTLLDNTTIVWTNELGKGNSHTLNNIPFLLVGGGLGFNMGRSLRLPNVAHNRLLLSLAHGFGHRLKTFGDPNHCKAGPLSELT